MARTRDIITLAIALVTWNSSLAVTPPIVPPSPTNVVITTFSTHNSPANFSESIKASATAIVPNVTGDEIASHDWPCPFVSEVSGISCTCDVPHTVRCRGQANRPEDLLTLTQTLTSEGVVSLLDLAVHGLGELPGGGFSNMNLLGLVVTTAGLQTVPGDAFKGLEESLAALGLPNNKLTIIPVDALKRLKQLQRLDVSDNLIQELKPRAFPTLLQLHNLNLAGNGLHLLHNEAFVRLPRLESLNLARNKLDAAQMNEKTLRGLHALERLSLQSNLLKGAITSTLITGARGLKSLDLSDNALTRVSRASLSACPELRDLDLSHNKIDVIEDHAFSDLKQLQRLKLSHNRVVAVSGWSLAHMPKLVHLALADNALRAVTGDLLHQLPSLNTLDLAANDISLLQPHVFNSTPVLQHLTLSDNPLHCDCTLKWFLHWLIQHPSLTKEERSSAVCATPPPLENAPLVELKENQLICSEETSSPYHDYHDYYHDYYHDDAIAEDSTEVRISDAEISLLGAHWVYKEVRDDKEPFFGVRLLWRVDDRAIPYTCEGVFVYQVIQGPPDAQNGMPEPHQVLMEKVEANCTSDGIADSHHVSVVVPGESLVPGATYRYCLILLERGTGDEEAFLPGCSEPLVLADAPFTIFKHKVLASQPPEVLSLTAGEVGGSLVVHTRVSGDEPCTYTLAIVSGQTVAATRELNCSEARHEFTSLAPGQYIVCADPNVPGLRFNYLPNLQNHLIVANNVTQALHRVFSECTPVVTLEPVKDKGLGMGPLLTLLFTLPGLALVVTLYLIAQRVWRGGGVPWRWDPRAQKSSKYFLYTGEITNPSLSLDPLPEDTPETTTPV